MVTATMQSHDGRLQSSFCRGVLLSPTIVFTTARMFKPRGDQKLIYVGVSTSDSGFAAAQAKEARILELPTELKNLFNPDLNVTDAEELSPFTPLDFAVLELHHALDKSSDSFLRIRKESNSKWLDNGHYVCYIGIPVPSYNYPSDVIRRSVSYFIAKTRPGEADALMESLIWNSLFDFKGPVVSCGAIHRLLSDRGQYLVNTTASTFEGFTGGPVINLDHPEYLVGFVFGAWKRTCQTVFLRADTPLIQRAYEIYVEDI